MSRLPVIQLFSPLAASVWVFSSFHALTYSSPFTLYFKILSTTHAFCPMDNRKLYKSWSGESRRQTDIQFWARVTKPNPTIVLSEWAIPIILGFELSLYYLLSNQIPILLGQSLCMSHLNMLWTTSLRQYIHTRCKRIVGLWVH